MSSISMKYTIIAHQVYVQISKYKQRQVSTRLT